MLVFREEYKRPMGYIAHLRNQLKSINTFVQSFDYIITLIWIEKMIILFSIIK